MSEAATTIYVCTSCRGPQNADARPGRDFLEALRARLKTRPEKSIAVEAVACLQVCGRPATVALAGGGKWTYTLADLDLAKEVDDLIHSAKLHAATQDGVAAWKDRPHCFRGKVVSRTPPLGFVGPQA